MKEDGYIFLKLSQYEVVHAYSFILLNPCLKKNQEVKKKQYQQKKKKTIIVFKLTLSDVRGVFPKTKEMKESVPGESALVCPRDEPLLRRSSIDHNLIKSKLS